MLPPLRARTAAAVAAAGLAALLGAPAFADVLVDNPGAPQVGSGNRAFAASWTQLSDYDDVSITAALFGVGVPGVTATAWLTTSIGLSASMDDVVATAPITSTTLFEGLDLGAGTYYLVTMFQSGSVAAGWRANNGTAMVSAPDVTPGGSYLGPFLSFPAFGPSADFAPYPSQLIYSVQGVPAVPEPATLAMFAAGLAGLWGVRRARDARSAGPR